MVNGLQIGDCFFFDYLGWFLFGHEAFGARFKMNGSFWVYN
jgi:hypothetical protein